MKLTDLMNEMNYNLKARENSGKSLLPKIEKDLIVSFAKQPNRTPEQISDFEADIMANANEFDNPSMYEGIEQVSAVYGIVNKMSQEQVPVTEEEVSMGRSM